MRYRTFSEGIKTGSGRRGRNSSKLMKFQKTSTASMTFEKAKKILIESSKGEFIDKGTFRRAQAIVTEHIVEVQDMIKQARKTEVGHTMGPPKTAELEVRGLKKLLAVRYPEKAAATAAEAAAKQALKKAGMKATAKSVARLAGKLTGILAAGYAVEEVVRRGIKLLKSKDIEKESECNPRIPQGNGYHASRGWY